MGEEKANMEEHIVDHYRRRMNEGSLDPGFWMNGWLKLES